MGSRRPAEHPDPVPREEGLRTIAKRVSRFSAVAQIRHALERPEADQGAAAVRDLLAGIESMPARTRDEQAEAFWRLVVAEIDAIGARDHSKRRTALHAAFLLGEERQPTLERRLERAREAGRFGTPELIGRDRPRQWWTDGVIDLALAVEQRMAELTTDPTGWDRYVDATRAAEQAPRRSPALPSLPVTLPMPVPADAQPVFVERHVATYFMRERVVGRSVSERRVRAMQHGVDGYIVRSYDPVGGPYGVTMRPLMNCAVGRPLRSLPDGKGGEFHEFSVSFPVSLLYGEAAFFATEVVHEGGDEAQLVEIQVTSHGIAAEGLTMRVQFEDGYHPAACWWFADVIDARRLDKPSPESGRRLQVSRYGFLEHTFGDACRPLAKYGLAWEW